MQGKVNWTLRRDGKVVERGERSNLIVDGMIGSILSWASGSPADPPGFIGTGTSANPSTKDMTDLVSEAVGTRTATTAIISATGKSVYYEATIIFGSAVDVQELGLFSDAAASGTLRARVLSTGFNASSGDELTVGWELFFDVLEVIEGS